MSACGWGPAGKIAVVLETAGLNAMKLGGYCRKRGLFPKQVARWLQAAQDCQCPAAADHGRSEGPPKAALGGSAGDPRAAAGVSAQGEGPGGGGGTADRLKKDPGLLGRGRGELTAAADRRKALDILDAAKAAGARARGVAALLGMGLTTLKRWRRQLAGDGNGTDGRKGSSRHVSHRLTDKERQRILLACNNTELAALPPGQIAPIIADRGLYIGS